MARDPDSDAVNHKDSEFVRYLGAFPTLVHDLVGRVGNFRLRQEPDCRVYRTRRPAKRE